ncbi:MAG: GNAT family N-acetyltransferase [Firmicutes bacterium]|nr:GNAT family N-acetyltransferase [Bacillota bacterium]
MRFELYNSINQYINDNMDVLARNEIQNNLIISNSIRGKEGADTTNWFMAAVKDTGGTPRLIVLMTPPYNLVLYELDNNENDKALNVLIHEIANLGMQIPGVLAEKSLACRFADEYSSLCGRIKEDGKKMRIYRLDRVNAVFFSSGKLRIADQNDLYFLPYWSIAFNLDCGIGMIDVPGAVDKVRKLLNDKILYIWEDGFPVSQAAMGRKTLNGAVVNAVYTPPHYRGKGYATSCVASLSKHLLDSDYKFCCLFTDLANPVSNSIYMKIGYKLVCDYDEYKFVCGGVSE